MASVSVVHGATAAAVASATTQAGQVKALVDALAGDVLVKVFAGATLLQTVTLGPSFVDTSVSPRRVGWGARQSASYSAAGTATKLQFCKADGTAIFEASTAVFSLAAVKLNCPVSVAGLAITAVVGLPLLTSAVWDGSIAVANTLSIKLPSGSATNYPLRFRRTFPKTGTGSIANYPQVTLDGTPATNWQADVLTRWGNGNARDAVISAIIPALATTAITIGFQNSATSNNTPATLASLLAGGNDFDAQVRAAVSGTPVAGSPISARAMATALADATLASNTSSNSADSRYWTQGPVCTTYLFAFHSAKTYDVGTTATKPLRAWFEVEYWPTISRVRVRCVAEICDSQKLMQETVDLSFWTANTTPVKRDEALAFTVGVRSWQSREYWIGANIATADLDHNIAYLAATRDFPNHDEAATTAGTIRSSYATDWAGQSKVFGANGYWLKNMPQVAGRPDLYFYPQWEVRRLYTGWADLHDICKAHMEFAGSWQMFVREGDAARTINGGAGIGKVLSKAAGGRPGLSFAATPDAGDALTVVGTPTDPLNGWVPDLAHLVEAFYVEWMLRGSYFAYEKMMQVASWSSYFINQGLEFSKIANGVAKTDMIPHTNQARGLAWCLRARARAWRISTDADTQMRYLWDKSLTDATQFLHGIYGVPGFEGTSIRDAWNTNAALWWTPQTGRPNALGIQEVGPYNSLSEPPDAVLTGGEATWQHNYVAAVLMHAVELGRSNMADIARFMTKLPIAVSTHPTHWGRALDDSYPTQKASGGLFQSAADLLDGYTSGTTGPNFGNYIDAGGYRGGGTPGTLGVIIDNYAITHSGTLAMAYHHELGDAAWGRFLTYYNLSATNSRLGYDQRWVIKPRAVPSA